MKYVIKTAVKYDSFRGRTKLPLIIFQKGKRGYRKMNSIISLNFCLYYLLKQKEPLYCSNYTIHLSYKEIPFYLYKYELNIFNSGDMRKISLL